MKTARSLSRIARSFVSPRLVVPCCLALMTLAGCAVPSESQRRLLDSMVGRSPVDLVRVFGVPTRSYSSGDRTFLAYIEDTSYYDPGSPSFGWGWGWRGRGWGGYGWGGGFPATYVQSACQTTFEIKDDHVTAWNIHGDGC